MTDLLEPLRVLIEGQRARIDLLESVNDAQSKEIDSMCDTIFELQQIISRNTEDAA